jgi:hypothetical protein
MCEEGGEGKRSAVFTIGVISTSLSRSFILLLPLLFFSPFLRDTREPSFLAVSYSPNHPASLPTSTLYMYLCTRAPSRLAALSPRSVVHQSLFLFLFLSLLPRSPMAITN